MANEDSAMRIVLKPDDAEIVRKIMALTGVSTGSDAVGMLLKKCGSRFISWWDTGCLVPAAQEAILTSASLPTEQKLLVSNGDFSEPIQF